MDYRYETKDETIKLKDKIKNRKKDIKSNLT